MEISVVGTGHVGLVTGVCFAELGHKVFCVDNDKNKIDMLKKGKIPIYEPGLSELMHKNSKKIRFTTDIVEGTRDSRIVFIAVGTPPMESGEADLSAVESVVDEIARSMTGYKLIVEKSTVPVQTGKRIKKIMKLRVKKGIEFDVASNPEFLREGSAVVDFLHPDRVVMGVESERAKELLLELYKPLGAPTLVTDIESAEIIKHASNSFLATRISFINAVAVLCEKAGANIKQVAEGMGLDKRIGKNFLDAGLGFGGFCFPKDLRAFRRISEKLGYEFPLLLEVEKINQLVKDKFIEKTRDILWNIKGKTIGILGLSFKPNTDDMRYAPSIYIIERLLEEGARIKAYDPKAMENAKNILGDVTFCKDPYEVADGADCLAIITEWDEFQRLNLERIRQAMRTPVVVDGRNIFEKAIMERYGFIYRGIGR